MFRSLLVMILRRSRGATLAFGPVVELADTPDLGSGAPSRRPSSTLGGVTSNIDHNFVFGYKTKR